MNETVIVRPTPDQIRAQLQRMLASPLFIGARRQSQFLEFVVNASLDGAEIKESLIGVEVYSRDPSYNPKSDSIVRAEASRLRAKLREYYETEGRADPVRIDLPKGSYTPAFQLPSASERVVEAPLPVTPAPATSGRPIPWKWVGVAGGILLATAAVAFWWEGRALKAHSIAVMPLTNLGPDRSTDSLSDTLTDEITRTLLSAPEWRVAGRAPSLDLAGRNQMLLPLRQDLRAEVVLTGSYRVGDNSNVRLTLQLLNVADGYLLWTQTYHHRLAMLAESHKDLARVVIADFTQAYTGKSTVPRTNYYAQAREAWSSYTRQGLEASLQLFQRAIQRDPGFAPAWAGLADANIRLSDIAGQPEQARMAEARKAAAQAIALDETNAEAHASLAKIYLFKDWNFQGAAQQLERAVSLDPVRISPSVLYSQTLTILGDMNAAEEVITAARVRLPPVPELLFQQGSVLFLARRFEKMEAVGRELISVNPASASGYWLVGVSLEQRGQLDQAIAEFKRGLQQAAKDDPRTLCALSHAYGLAGDAPLALATLSGYIKPEKEVTRFALPYCMAMTYAGLKQNEKAFEWLEKARASKDASFPFFPRDPRFDPLKGDARYQELADSLHTGR